MMKPASANWKPMPTIELPLQYPTAVRDWINDDQDTTFRVRVGRRKYRLEREEMLNDASTVVYSYVEVEV